MRMRVTSSVKNAIKLERVKGGGRKPLAKNDSQYIRSSEANSLFTTSPKMSDGVAIIRDVDGRIKRGLLERYGDYFDTVAEQTLQKEFANFFWVESEGGLSSLAIAAAYLDTTRLRGMLVCPFKPGRNDNPLTLLDKALFKMAEVTGKAYFDRRIDEAAFEDVKARLDKLGTEIAESAVGDAMRLARGEVKVVRAILSSEREERAQTVLLYSEPDDDYDERPPDREEMLRYPFSTLRPLSLLLQLFIRNFSVTGTTKASASRFFSKLEPFYLASRVCTNIRLAYHELVSPENLVQFAIEKTNECHVPLKNVFIDCSFGELPL